MSGHSNAAARYRAVALLVLFSSSCAVPLLLYVALCVAYIDVVVILQTDTETIHWILGQLYPCTRQPDTYDGQTHAQHTTHDMRSYDARDSSLVSVHFSFVRLIRISSAWLASAPSRCLTF